MSESVILWIFGFVISGAYAVAAALGGVMWRIHDEGLEARRTMGERIVRIETAFGMMGEKWAKILHSPHTPELDSFIEKLQDPSHVWPKEDQDRFIELCDIIENDPKEVRQERALAAGLSVALEMKFNRPMRKHNKHQ